MNLFTRSTRHCSEDYPARSIAQAVIGRAAFFGFGYVATVILARGLGPVDYGVYGIVMSVLLLVEQTGKSTIAPAATILIPKESREAEALQGAALFASALLHIALFGALWALAPSLAQLVGLDDGAGLIRLAALDLPFFGMYALYRGVLLGRREFVAVTIVDVLYSATKLALVALLFMVWLSVANALVVNVLASIGALLFAISRLSIRVSWPANGLIGRLNRCALPLGLYMFALQTVSSVDLWLLNWLTGGEDGAIIGVYVAARNVAMVPGIVLMAVSDVLMPSLSHAVGNGDTTATRAFLQGAVRFLWILSLPSALFFVVAADDLMVLLFSTSFAGGAAHLPFLIVHGLSLAFISLFAAALSARGQLYLSAAVLFAVGPVAVLLNVVLIGTYGAVGAAYASAATGMLGSVTLGALVFKRFGALLRIRTLTTSLLAATLLALGANQLQIADLPSVLVSLACLALYGAGLVLFGELSRRDLKSFGVRPHAVR